MSRRTEGPTLIIVNETVSEAMAFLDVLDAQLIKIHITFNQKIGGI